MSASKFQPPAPGDEPSTIVECPGESRAFGAKFKGNPHPTAGNLRRLYMKNGKDYWSLDRYYTFHPPCMHCYADMGCFRCSGLTEELLCMKCRDWAHPDALEKHGKLAKTPTEKLKMQQGLKIIEGMVAKTKPVEAQ